MVWRKAVMRDWQLCPRPSEALVFFIEPVNVNYDAFALGVDTGNVYMFHANNAPDTYGRNTWYRLNKET